MNVSLVIIRKLMVIRINVRRRPTSGVTRARGVVVEMQRLVVAGGRVLQWNVTFPRSQPPLLDKLQAGIDVRRLVLFDVRLVRRSARIGGVLRIDEVRGTLAGGDRTVGSLSFNNSNE